MVNSKLKTINIKLHEGQANNYQNMLIDNLNKLSSNRLIRHNKKKRWVISLDYIQVKQVTSAKINILIELLSII